MSISTLGTLTSKFLEFPHMHRTTLFLTRAMRDGGPLTDHETNKKATTLLMVAATLLSATRPCCPRVDGVRPLCATPSFSAAASRHDRSAAVPSPAVRMPGTCLCSHYDACAAPHVARCENHSADVCCMSNCRSTFAHDMVGSFDRIDENFDIAQSRPGTY